MTNEKFEKEMEKIKEANKQKEMKRKLRDARRGAKLSTSKLVVLGMFLLVLEIIIFAEVAMMKYGDFSAMYVLIGIPATLIPTIMAYFSKSKSENTAGGIVYEKAMKELNTHVDNDEVCG